MMPKIDKTIWHHGSYLHKQPLNIMDRKVTTLVGLAVGASLLAGFGIYKLISNRRNKTHKTLVTEGGTSRNGLADGFIGNGFVKSTGLYKGIDLANGLIGGGLYKLRGAHIGG